MLRHAANQLFIARGWYGIPAATLLVNVAGCLLGGLVLAWLDTKGPSAPLWRSLLLTGFLGGLTTFSALGIELWQFLRAGRLDLALWANGGPCRPGRAGRCRRLRGGARALAGPAGLTRRRRVATRPRRD